MAIFKYFQVQIYYTYKVHTLNYSVSTPDKHFQNNQICVPTLRV